MRVLLDESLPRQLKRHLLGHQVRTVPEIGWAGRRNGELLRLAAGHFDVFVTADRHLSEQQNLGEIEFALVILLARSNAFEDLEPLLPRLLALLPTLVPGQVVRVGAALR
jgi:uncharacterized protein DUF5615